MSALIEFFWKDWYFAYPLLLMSLVAVALVVWRIILNFNAGTNLGLLLPALQTKLDKEGVDAAIKLCKAQPPTQLIPQKLFVAGLEQAKHGSAAMRRGMANAIELDIVPQLNFLLAPILAIAKIATMLGLLGTVISMIGTFTKIQDAQKPKDAVVAPAEAAKGESPGGTASYAGAIGLALFATALGLITAIPLVFAHVMFKDWITGFETKMKGAGQKLVLMVQTAKTPPEKPARGATAEPASGGKPAVPASSAGVTTGNNVRK